MSDMRDMLKQIEFDWSESGLLDRISNAYAMASGDDMGYLREDLAVLEHLAISLDELIHELPEDYDWLDDGDEDEDDPDWSVPYYDDEDGN